MVTVATSVHIIPLRDICKREDSLYAQKRSLGIVERWFIHSSFKVNSFDNFNDAFDFFQKMYSNSIKLKAYFLRPDNNPKRLLEDFTEYFITL